MCIDILIDSDRMNELYQEWSKSLSNEEINSINDQINPSKHHYSFKRNPYNGFLVWDKLKQGNYPKRYLLVAHPVADPFGGKASSYNLYFLDIQKTAFILAKYYEVFQSIAEMDFEPLEVIFEIENPQSSFWNKVLDHDKSKGLLCGFGEKNVLFYQWQNEYKNRQGKIANYLRNNPLSYLTNDARDLKDIEKLGPNNFEIPIFWGSFEDEMVERYSREKEKIQQIYKKRDLVEVTLMRLLNE